MPAFCHSIYNKEANVNCIRCCFLSSGLCADLMPLSLFAERALLYFTLLYTTHTPPAGRWPECMTCCGFLVKIDLLQHHSACRFLGGIQVPHSTPPCSGGKKQVERLPDSRSRYSKTSLQTSQLQTQGQAATRRLSRIDRLIASIKRRIA